VRIDEAKLRETIKRLLIEADATDESTIETVMKAVMLGKIEGINALTNVTNDLDDVPDFIKQFNALNLQWITGKASDPNPIKLFKDGNGLKDPSVAIKGSSVPQFDFDKPYDAKGKKAIKAYKFSPDSKVGKLFIENYNNPQKYVQSIIDSLDAGIAKNRGDSVEFAVAGIMSLLAPNIAFLNMAGQEEGRDIVFQSPELGLSIIESKSSQKPEPNTSLGSTPGKFGYNNKFFLFASEGGRVQCVREDLLALYWSLALGRNSLDVEGEAIEDLQDTEPETELVKYRVENYKKAKDLIDRWEEFRQTLAAAARQGEANDALNTFVNNFLKNIHWKSESIKMLDDILTYTLMQQYGAENETGSNLTNPEDVSSLRIDMSGLKNFIVELEKSTIDYEGYVWDQIEKGSQFRDPDVATALGQKFRQYLAPILSQLHRMFALTYMKDVPQAPYMQPTTPYVQAQHGTKITPATGTTYKKSTGLAQYSANNIAVFISQFLVDPNISIDAKSNFVTFLSDIKMGKNQPKGSQAAGHNINIGRAGDQYVDRGKSLAPANKIYWKVMATQSARQIMMRQFARNPILLKEFLDDPTGREIDFVTFAMFFFDSAAKQELPANISAHILTARSAQIIAPKQKEVSVIYEFEDDLKQLLMDIFPSASEVLSIDRDPIVKGDPTPLHIKQQSQRPTSNRRMQPPNRFNPPAFNQTRRFEENVNNNSEVQTLNIAIENYSEILQNAENDIQQFDVFDQSDYSEFAREMQNYNSQENIEESKLYESIIRKLLAASKKRR
jgi:cell fate (sporulation/competence/biofilm development) regulator YlbF (YheA/YmcA/DUF963 family)